MELWPLVEWGLTFHAELPTQWVASVAVLPWLPWLLASPLTPSDYFSSECGWSSEKGCWCESRPEGFLLCLPALAGP